MGTAGSGTVLTRCYNKADITARSSNVGGIAGSTTSGSPYATAVSCYNTGVIRNTNTAATQPTGGISGQESHAMNCVNAGSVRCDVSDGYDRVGPISGTGAAGVAAGDTCYYLESGYTGSKSADNIVPVSTSQLSGADAYGGAPLLDALNAGAYAGTWVPGDVLDPPQPSPALAWEAATLAIGFDTGDDADAPHVTPVMAAPGVTISKPVVDPWICHELEGWYADSALTRRFDFAEAVTESMTLHAKWNTAHVPAAAVRENDAPATCTERGSYESVESCTVCGNEASRSVVTVAALGHDWGAWSVTRESSAVEAGERQRVCARDHSHVDTEPIPAIGLDANRPGPEPGDSADPKAGSNANSTAGPSTGPSTAPAPGTGQGASEDARQRDESAGEGQDANPSGSDGPGTSSSKPSGTSVYRLYNRYGGEHLYTADKKEARSLVATRTGWTNEGIAWTAPGKSSRPVFRLYDERTHGHRYTASKKRRSQLKRKGYRYEGVCWYSDASHGVAVRHFYNPYAKSWAAAHFHTADKREMKALRRQGWTKTGAAWYGSARGRGGE